LAIVIGAVIDEVYMAPNLGNLGFAAGMWFISIVWQEIIQLNRHRKMTPLRYKLRV